MSKGMNFKHQAWEIWEAMRLTTTRACQEQEMSLGQLLGAQKTYAPVDLGVGGHRGCSSSCTPDLSPQVSFTLP